MVLKEAVEMEARVPAGLDTKTQTKIAKSVKRVTILKTLWYPEILEALSEGARAYLLNLGVNPKAIALVEVSGALELPLAAKYFAKSSDFLVVLGCVVNGQTPHCDFVCQSAFDGLMSVQLESGTPLGNGVLTVSNMEQAEARKSKGKEAAQAAFFQYALKRKLKRKK